MTTTASGLRTDLRGFREVQRLAYECAEAVAARPTPGGTEREAARTRREWLRERGVRLRAVEHHLGFRGTGAKSGEILVVTDSADPEESAFWPDDDLPHVRRWAEER
ncbi:hypothetical protein [Streptomyces sp. NPDC048392]|uniref:hypothetical protein n=1 Tax=Streptomyces sp. NPDC048392 TaxID=3365543 RepID=UPI00371ACDDA